MSAKEQRAVENDNLTRKKADLKATVEMERNLDTLDSLLRTAESGSVNAVAIRNIMSQVFNTNVRALAELESFASFGNIAERITRGVSKFLTGQLDKKSLGEISKIASQMRNDVVTPYKAEISNFYSMRTEAQGGRPELVSETNNIKDMTVEEIQAELEALRNGR